MAIYQTLTKCFGYKDEKDSLMLKELRKGRCMLKATQPDSQV